MARILNTGNFNGCLRLLELTLFVECDAFHQFCVGLVELNLGFPTSLVPNDLGRESDDKDQACLIFVVGLTTQVIRHQRSGKAQVQLNQADAKLMEGVAFYKKGQFKQAEAAIKVAGVQDPSHPMGWLGS